jgi:3-methyl-2-oxobutanoate hydroxymethyltransferase
MSKVIKSKALTILDFQKMKQRQQKITMLTAYDYSAACMLEECSVDMILIGDSVGMVFSGYPNTLPVTLGEIIYHTKAVRRGAPESFIIADMPFMSYQVNCTQAKENAFRLIKESGAQAVKLEGGQNVVEVIDSITRMDVPVMGHIGLTPQSIHKMGGYRIQGKNEAQRKKLFDDAKAVEQAGAFALVLEGIPADLAEAITAALSIPTIGIGAGVHCDGQVLVFHDLLGLQDELVPKFVKQYVAGKEIMKQGIKQYIEEVRGQVFPGPEHSFLSDK